MAVGGKGSVPRLAEASKSPAALRPNVGRLPPSRTRIFRKTSVDLLGPAWKSFLGHRAVSPSERAFAQCGYNAQLRGEGPGGRCRSEAISGKVLLSRSVSTDVFPFAPRGRGAAAPRGGRGVCGSGGVGGSLGGSLGGGCGVGLGRAALPPRPSSPVRPAREIRSPSRLTRSSVGGARVPRPVPSVSSVGGGVGVVSLVGDSWALAPAENSSSGVVMSGRHHDRPSVRSSSRRRGVVHGRPPDPVQ